MTRTPLATVDLSAFTGTGASESERVAACRALVEACHQLGFVKIKGHGFPKQELDEAMAWVKKLFDLPYEDKMKAPHPETNIPHRGYSGIGREKVYSQDDMEKVNKDENVADQLRAISDFKESYEIGSEHDDQQQNIWLPDDILPNFRAYFTSLYERLAGVSKVLLDAFGVGLGLDVEAHSALMQLLSDRHSQLRLLHYPLVDKEKLKSDSFTRLPAHTDWGTFTLLFQDDRGGLELRDPASGEFVHAEPEEGALVLNIGDMLQRFTNDYFISAVHRVTIPDPTNIPELGVPERYSIPFFVGPMPSHVIATLPQFITADTPQKYDPVRFDEYGALVSKYQYQGDEEKS